MDQDTKRVVLEVLNPYVPNQTIQMHDSHSILSGSNRDPEYSR